MRLSVRQITLVGILGAMTVALGFMPVGGFIPVPTPAGSATTMHIPTILAGIFEGPVAGGIVGAIFGGFSFWRAQTQANPVAKLMFTNPLIAFLPRILIGVVSHYVYSLAKGRKGHFALMSMACVALGHTGYWAFGGKPQAYRFVAAALFGLGGLALIVLVNRRANIPGPALAAVTGSITNTAGVMGLSVAFGYLPVQAAAGVGVMHGIPEAMVAMVLTDLIYRGTRHIREP
ncbi:MAG: ECF transporter S component [Bacillota bacterium]